MNYTETLQYIHSLGKFTMPASLDRIKAVMQMLDNPQNKFKSIHIAGTNGKGSVSAMLHSAFKFAGYKTGLFISPFIIDFKERIQINGEFISEKDLIEFSQRIIDTKVSLNEFEFITAVAFLYFSEQNCDIVICETGLGGRLDATNVLENKVATVITKISLDHTAILGDTLEAIAFEKCGIIRKCPTVTSPYQPEEAYSVIKSNAETLVVPDIKKLNVPENYHKNNTYIYNEEKYKLSLKGDFQIENSLMVIEAIRVSGFNIPQHIIYKALASTYFPARLEVVSQNPLVIIDGAHNPDGATVLAKELEWAKGDAVAIIGMMKDKDCRQVLETTLPNCKSAIAVEVKGLPRSLSAQELCVLASPFCRCEIAENYNEALSMAQAKAGNNPIFIFGSLYLAAEMRNLFSNN